MNKLKPGDCVSIVAPASRQTKDSIWMLEAGVEVLKGWGLRVKCNFSASRKHFYLAGDDIYRADALLSAFNDPEVKAVFTTRGGYGSARLLPAFMHARGCNPKILIGYSDICALMSACSVYMPQVACIHGPSVATPGFLDDSESGVVNRNRLFDILFNEEDAYQQSIEIICPGAFKGSVIGGNLSILTSLLGTPYMPDFDHKVLFLEDVGEKPYSIDRMLNQFAQSGKFDHIKGIVFGDLTDCTDSVNDLRAVIADVLVQYDFPVVCGFKAGHGMINTAFRMGQQLSVDYNHEWLQIT